MNFIPTIFFILILSIYIDWLSFCTVIMLNGIMYYESTKLDIIRIYSCTRCFSSEDYIHIDPFCVHKKSFQTYTLVRKIVHYLYIILFTVGMLSNIPIVVGILSTIIVSFSMYKYTGIEL